MHIEISPFIFKNLFKKWRLSAGRLEMSTQHVAIAFRIKWNLSKLQHPVVIAQFHSPVVVVACHSNTR